MRLTFSPSHGIQAVKRRQFRVEIGGVARQIAGSLKKRLRAHGKELGRVAGSVFIEERGAPLCDVGLEVLEMLPENPGPSARVLRVCEIRDAVRISGGLVDLVGELVKHDIETIVIA
jgi:hypothetical protein